jgi:hypothetical protein
MCAAENQENDKEDTEGEKSIILVFAEEDFGFARDMLDQYKNCEIFATSFRSKNELLDSYGFQLSKNISALHQHGAKIYFNIDVGNVNKKLILEVMKERVKGDKIVPLHIYFPFNRVGYCTECRSSWIKKTYEGIIKAVQDFIKFPILCHRNDAIILLMLENQYKQMQNISNKIRRKTKLGLENNKKTFSLFLEGILPFSGINFDHYKPLNEKGIHWLKRRHQKEANFYNFKFYILNSEQPCFYANI